MLLFLTKSLLILKSISRMQFSLLALASAVLAAPQSFVQLSGSSIQSSSSGIYTVTQGSTEFNTLSAISNSGFWTRTNRIGNLCDQPFHDGFLYSQIINGVVNVKCEAKPKVCNDLECQAKNFIRLTPELNIVGYQQLFSLAGDSPRTVACPIEFVARCGSTSRQVIVQRQSGGLIYALA